MTNTVAAWALRATTLLFPVLVSGLPACTAEVNDPEPVSEDLGSDSAEVKECDRSPYNCKLPAAHKDRNRIFNYATNSYDWPIAPGTALLDGLGNVRGKVKGSSVRINYGGRKKIHAVAHVYAFAVGLDTGVTASGWVREDALDNAPIKRMPTVKLGNPGKGDYEATWVVSGGDPGSIAGLKVIKDFDGNNGAGTDYLVRPGNVVNFLYNLPGSGGVATDTFPVGVTFKRSKGVEQLSVPLYHEGGTKQVGHMDFIYGHIGGRYGWIARDALTMVPEGASFPGAGAGPAASDPGVDDLPADPGSAGETGDTGAAPAPSPEPAAEPAPVPECYARCCDGSLSHTPAADAGQCIQASQIMCDGHGYVKRAELGGGEVYARANACYAKCANRTAYHEVDGVTSGCTEAAQAYCKVGDRGAFQDAAWSQCPM
jgi:hypothetical protein